MNRGGDRSSEIDRIASIASAFAASSGAIGGAADGIARGIGDDAAVLDASARAGKIVWTIDAQVEGVHFRADLASWEDIGWRSFMAAASDVAAMARSCGIGSKGRPMKSVSSPVTITRLPASASLLQVKRSPSPRNCPSSIPITSVRGSTFSSISSAVRTRSEPNSKPECETIPFTE